MTRSGRAPEVTVLFTGGTIGMRKDPEGGVLPSASGSELLALAGPDPAFFALDAIEWGALPSMHLSFRDVLEIARVIRERLRAHETDGAVVVQGTDTIEETSIAFDLLVGGEKPLVVTGAMRNLDDEGYDGLANLRSAVLCARSRLLRGQGTVVVMDGVIHGADDAVKVRSNGLGAFESPHVGPLGHIVDGDVALERTRGSRGHLACNRFATPIPLVTALLDGDGLEVRAAIEAGAVGIVVAASGAGQTSPAVFRECRRAIARGVPVVLASRSIGGRPESLYGYEAAGIEWERSGAIFAGTLSGPKARIALSLGLGAGLDQSALRALFVTTAA